MANKKIVIEFLGESKDLRNAIDDVDGKSSKLSSTLGKVGKAAAIGLGVGVVAGATALVGMTKAAVEDEASQAKLAKALENTAGANDKQIAAAEDWIAAQGKALGVTDDELRPALAKLATATRDVGEAQELTSLAMDAAAGTGKSLESVSTALMKARNGDVSSLSKLGIATKNAAGETMSFEQITKSMSDTFGGQAATAANTLDGKMDRLKLIFDETKETIGAKLIPVLTKAGDWILGVGVPAVESFVQQWKDGVGTGGQVADAFGKIKDAAAAAIGFLVEHKNVAIGLAAAFVAFKAVQLAVAAGTAIHATVTTVASAATKVWAATQWLLNAALTANPIGLVVVAIAALVGGLIFAWKKSETFREIVTGALNAVKDVALAVAGFFKDTLPEFFQKAWNKAKEWTTGGIDAIVNWVKDIPGKIGNALSNLTDKVRTLFEDAWDAGKTKVVNIGGAIVDWVAGIPGRFVNNLSNLLSTVRDIFDGAMTAGKDKVTGIGGTILDWIQAIPGKIGELGAKMGEAGRDLLQRFIDGLKNAAGIIEGIAGKVWDTVRGLLNSAITKINSALEFTIHIPGPDINVDLPDIPHLAKGGLVTRPTLALIGEDGPEAVVPLSRKHNPGGSIPGGGGGGITVNVFGPTDPMGVVRELEKFFVQYQRSTGRPLAFTAS